MRPFHLSLPICLGLVACSATFPQAHPHGSRLPEVEPEETRACVLAHRLFREDFEDGDYSRWTGGTYHGDWGPESRHCRDAGFSTDVVRSGQRAHRSAVTCRSHTHVHRGYGGLQLSGEEVVPRYTNRGVGTDAPHGMVTTFWVWIDVPYRFQNGRWLSLWTVNTDCGYEEEVVTLGLESAEHRLAPAHVTGTVVSPDAPTMPLREWARVTIYVNAHSGTLHVWQDGQHVTRSSFRRASNTLCQWHWGLYASGDNDRVVVHEDDISLWVLDEEWTDFSREPYLDEPGAACE
jgi:hypothetical protein